MYGGAATDACLQLNKRLQPYRDKLPGKPFAVRSARQLLTLHLVLVWVLCAFVSVPSQLVMTSAPHIAFGIVVSHFVTYANVEQLSNVQNHCSVLEIELRRRPRVPRGSGIPRWVTL